MSTATTAHALHAAPELPRLLRLLEQRGVKLVAIGHGRSPAAQITAAAFADAWRSRGGHIAVAVDWPAEAASWLRHARRLTAHHVDAWVIADTAAGWESVARRLAPLDDWRPQDTVAFAAAAGPELVPLACSGALEGLCGPTSTGELWHVHGREIVRHRPTSRRTSQAAALFSRPPVEIVPGAIHVPDWLPVDTQRMLVDYCRKRATAPAPMRATKLPRGGTMSVRTACLGWHWAPYRYSRTADDVDGARVPAMPPWLQELGQRALADAYGSDDESTYLPDAALINFYDEHARLGMHQDKDERSLQPVVSLSIGQPCVFRLGGTQRRSGPHIDLELHSGDLLVLGGPARLAYHAVTKLLPAAVDPEIGLRSGRLNLTLRVTGLHG